MRKKFINPHVENTRRSFFHFLLWQCGFYRDSERLPSMPLGFKYPNPLEKVDFTKPLVTWVNHSTFWIKAFGKGILFDPIWNERCSPLSFIGPRRHIDPAPSFNCLHPIDYVIISHNHYDHLDKSTIRLLKSAHPFIQWIVPKGVKKWLLRTLSLSEERVIELNWWQSYNQGSLTFTAVPAQHFSGRGFFDRDRSLWMGCVIEFDAQKKVYFAGDTGYNPYDFKEIGIRFKGVDLSLLPIGVYIPRPFMQAVHVNPKESITIHKEVLSSLSVGGHWGTFRLSSEPLDRPPYDAFCALQEAGISFEHFRILNPGQTINW